MKQIEQAVLKFLQERKWDNLRPGDLAKSISIEAGELLELFQWSNPELADVRNDPVKIEAIKKELADILIYSFDTAVLLGIDVEEIVREKFKYISKKYPVDLMRERSGQEPGTESLYWKIKKEHRQKSD